MNNCFRIMNATSSAQKDLLTMYRVSQHHVYFQVENTVPDKKVTIETSRATESTEPSEIWATGSTLTRKKARDSNLQTSVTRGRRKKEPCAILHGFQNFGKDNDICVKIC